MIVLIVFLLLVISILAMLAIKFKRAANNADTDSQKTETTNIEPVNETVITENLNADKGVADSRESKTLNAESLAEKNRRLWAMNEAVYREKKKLDEELDKLNSEKNKLEQAKSKLDDKIKKLWQTSTAVHKEKERINQLKLEIEIRHQEIVDSVTYAQRIQEAMLPSLDEIKIYIPEYFILFKPRDIVSGDFFWFSRKEPYTFIACVECTGHGVPGAFMSLIGNTILNQVVNERNISSPDEILNTLSWEVMRVLKQDREGSDSRDGMDITMLRLEDTANHVLFSSANRPVYHVRNNSMTEFKGTKQAIGGTFLMDYKPFDLHILPIEKGDCIYLSSDGYADQFSPADKKLMTKRFREELSGIQHLSMQEQGMYLDEYFTRWKSTTEQTDDVLVIGIRVN